MKFGLKKFLMTAFGTGLLKPFSGTWGSMPPVALVLLLLWLIGPGLALNSILIGIGVIFSVICVTLGDWAEREFAGKDPRQVVADEVAGQCLALLFLPWRSVQDDGAWTWNLLLALGAFACFRGFDILKPPPINRSQKLPAGWGILADDLIAGTFALITVQLAARLLIPAMMSS